MGKAERAKGARAQTEAAQAVRDLLGIDCRNGAANGVAGGDDLVTPGVAVRWEVKRTERPRLAEYVRQASRDAGEAPPVVLWRGNRLGWSAIIPLDRLGKFAERIVEARRRQGP